MSISFKMSALALGLAGALGMAATAAVAETAAPVAQVTKAAPLTDMSAARYRRHRDRTRVYVYRNNPFRGPYAEGFYDQGFAYHGNINGCAVDLGYGRYEPCGAGR